MGQGKREIIDLGQDNQAQVVFSIVIPHVNMQLLKFRYASSNFTFTKNTINNCKLKKRKKSQTKQRNQKNQKLKTKKQKQKIQKT